ncbi:MAG: response regulator, partial [Planctomycetota bacterium]
PREAGAPASTRHAETGAHERGPILVIEDNPTTRKMFRISLESAGHRVVEAQDARTALRLIQEIKPALIVQDLILPDMDGLELARMLRDRLGLAPVPILCVSGFLSRLDEARAMEGGFAQVLVKPVDPLQLLDVVRIHLTSLPTDSKKLGQGRRLLIVDDDPLHLKLAEVWMSSAGFEVMTATDGVAALELARRETPAVIVSDVLMPRMDGFGFCLAVRRDSKLANVPVILNSSAYVEAEDHSLARRVGASALLAKSEGMEAVVAAVSAGLSSPRPEALSEQAELIEGEHARRALWQLERQVQQNSQLAQRTTLQEAQLAVLAGVAESLARHQVVDGVLGDVLAACLDMAGISKGALYTVEGDKQLTLKHQIGFSELEGPRLRDLFGCGELFSTIAERRKVVMVPSSAVSAEVSRSLSVEAGATSLLLVPVFWADNTFGMMLLGARTSDISGEDALAFARVLGAQMGQAIGLARSFSNLAASEKRYRTLTENANDAICILTSDGVIREVNRRLTEILGFPIEQFIGRHIREFAPAGRADEMVRRFGSTAAQVGTPARPFELKKHDGGIALMEFSTAGVDIGGEQLFFSIGRDVTDQVRAQAQLMVSDRMASVGALAAGVAHEINNPLAAVLANLDFAVKDADQLAGEFGSSPRVAELQESIREAREAADRVRQIVKDLKIFSRAEEDKRGAVDVQRVMESSLRMAWNEIRHRARLVKHYGAVPMVDANESRLGQVFLNLVVNAAQAIPEGHADTNLITVTTRADARGLVVVEIQDSGPGIPAEIQKQLFTPFFTTKPAGVGTGLGLTICQRIVHGLGGEISVESKLGEGTLVRVVLPASSALASESVPARVVRPSLRRGRVLLVDDDVMIGNAVRRTLAAEHEVVAVTQAQEALRRIAAGDRFDVILCDMMMPLMSGSEFFQQLTQLAPEQAERVVFLTGGAFTANARAFLDEVPNARMEKPFEVQNLRALVNDRVR